MRYRLNRLNLLAALLGSLSACGNASTTAPSIPAGATRVLFIGNSLTYVNGLPGMFVDLAKLGGDPNVYAETVAFPDFALEDHWAQGTARRTLSEHPWEFVVMQQGSSALPESQVNLRTWSLQFAPLIRAAGATPVMYMVWPFASRTFDFPGVLQSYRNAASAINGIFAPAGDGWTTYGDLTALYSADGLHPTVQGTYIAALVLLERIRGIRPEQLPAIIPGAQVPESQVRALQQAARRALDRNDARPAATAPM